MTDTPDKPPFQEHARPLPNFLRSWGASRHGNDYRIFCGCHHVLARIYGPPEERDFMFRKEIERRSTSSSTRPT